ncbi:hypothetical protein WL40_10785 [Burkholderia ubonensis]|uniref:Tc toxin subunit A n=1 Tax=Burkholderia ubonensis TaxID=101571 RepID=UPI00075F6BB7|nr:Tc toxin subunit A [Burkholderia ubonensis]KWB72613.1 hypothetical protein WL40_10785 [Burkholderia ubonensis]
MTLTSPLIQRTETLYDLPDALSKLGYHSVFDVVRVPRERFIRQHRSTLGRRAEKMYDLAIGYAHQVSHAFRHNRVTRAVNAALSGPFSKPGPDYTSQFLDAKTGWKDKAPSGAPEANDGPVAYLTHIYHRALQEESAGASDLMNKLSERRPDIGKLVVDNAALNQEIPQIQLVNEVLGSAIQGAQKLSDRDGVNTLLSTTRYPNTLPFHFGSQQIRVAESTLDVALAEHVLPQSRDLVQAFWAINTTLNETQASDLARLQIMASQLAPEQQQIIVEPAYFGHHHLLLSDIYDPDDSTRAWTGPSMSESLAYQEFYSGAFILPLQDNVVDEYDDRPRSLINNGTPGLHSQLTFWVTNGSDKKLITLRGQNCDYYQIKINDSIGVECDPYQNKPRLFYVPDDNPEFDPLLKSGPWYGQITLNYEGASGGRHDLTLSVCLNADSKVKYTSAQTSFYLNNYGDSSLNSISFADMTVLTSRTGLTVPQVEQLLCATAGGDKAFTVVISNNFVVPNAIFSKSHSSYPTAAVPFIYGAKFIHVGMPNACTITKGDDSTLTLVNITDDKMDRINRMVRLQMWLGLPFEDIDLLVTSAMEAEGDANRAFLMNDNTLRTLALFQHYQSTYDVSAKQFAAWLNVVTPFAITPAKPFLDQVFNSSGAFDTPFVVDNQDFVYTLTTGDDGARVKKICAALGLNHRQFLMFADQIARQQGDASLCTLNCNLFVVSAFYRLVSIAKALGLTPDDFYALIDLLDQGTGTIWKQMAGQPLVAMPQKDAKFADDFLTLLQALSSIVQWMQKNRVSARATALLVTSGNVILPSTGNYGTVSYEGQMQRISIGWKDLAYNVETGDITLTQQVAFRPGANAASVGISVFEYALPDGLNLNGSVSWQGDAPTNTSINPQYGAGSDWPFTWPGTWIYPSSDKTYVLNIPLKGTFKDLSKLSTLTSKVKIHPYSFEADLNFSQGDVVPANMLTATHGTNDQLSLIHDVWQHLLNTLVDTALVQRSGAPLVDNAGKAIDWWSPLSGDNKLIDTCGLVTDAADTTVSVMIGGKPVSIIKLVSDLVDAQALSDTEKTQAKSSLNAAVIQARQTQTGVATSLLAKTLATSQSLPALVLRWAQLTPYQWLKRTWALKATVRTPADIPAAYLGDLQEIARRALICQQFSLSPAMVQQLLSAPDQFRLPASYAGNVTLWMLYMLSRYDDLLHQVGGSGQGTEDDVLAYLQAVNRDSPLSGQEAAEQLASLLGWEQEEVLAAWQVLGGTAKTIPDLDVVLRLQQAERETGLTVGQQQQAFALSRDSSYDAWQAVGQAMVAGANHVKGDY